MRRPIPILSVLLVASLLGNAILASRVLREAWPSASPRAVGLARRVEVPHPSAAVEEAFEVERRINESLRAEIEQLKADHKLLAQASLADSAAQKLSQFREAIRFEKRMRSKDYPPPDNAHEMISFQEFTMAHLRMAALKETDPGAYVECLRVFFEVALEGEGADLSAAQSSELGKLWQDLAQEILRLPPAPSGDWLIKELELEAHTMSRVRDVLTETQRERQNFGMLMLNNDQPDPSSMDVVSTQEGAKEIVRMWARQYRLEVTQLPQAKAAAQSYIDALGRLEARGLKESSLDEFQGALLRYDNRVASLREQIVALDVLSASLTSAQKDLVRTLPMREVFLFEYPTPGVKDREEVVPGARDK